MHSKTYPVRSKYNVPPLQAAALKKSGGVAKHSLERKDIAKAIPVILGSTPESDTALRSLAMRVLLHDLHQPLNQVEFIDYIEDTEGLVLKLLKKQMYGKFTKSIACRVCGTSKARRCNGSLNRNPRSYVACDCDEEIDGYCGSCSKHW